MEKKVSQRLVDTSYFVTNDKLSRFQVLAKKHGVGIVKTVREGEQYNFYDDENKRVTTATVGPGKTMVHIVADKPLSDFWEEVRSQS